MDKISSPKLPELVINTFFKALENGDIKIGQPLFSEKELAEKLEISRGSLREGLSILEFLGVISNKGNRKFVEKDYQSIQGILKLLKLTEKKNIINDYIEFRNLVELYNVKLACENANYNDLKELEIVINELNTDPDTAKQDYNFHMEIAKIGKNEFLIAITELLFKMINDIRPNLIEYPGRKPFIIEECEEIFQFIKEHEVEKAQNAMKKHLFFIEKTLSVINNLN